MMEVGGADGVDMSDGSMINETSKFDKVDTKKLLFIEYPGYIRDKEKMLETLGGQQKLSQTFFKTKCRLPLTYRPEDLNSHKVCGDLVPFTGLLLKVRRRKKAGTPDGYEYRQEVVGIVREQYKFQSLMDYQYLTPEPLWNYFNNIHGSELGTSNLPSYFAPPTFARGDRSGSYDYKPDLVSPNTAKEDDRTPDMLEREVARKRRQTESMAALFTSTVLPTTASEKAIASINSLKLGSEKDNIELIGKLFEERPLWSKLALSCKVNVGVEKLKKILAYYSFYWLSGPWRTMWCRMGYDPRKDPKAKIYQMIDFRVRDSKEARKNYKTLVPRRSHKNYVPITLRNVFSRAPSGSVLEAFKGRDEKRNVDAEPHIFRPDKKVVSRSMMYQLCDIHDPTVQEIIRENDGTEQCCDEKEGWFQQGTMNRIRDAMTLTVDAYFAKEKEKKKQKSLEELSGNNQADGERTYYDEGDFPTEEEDEEYYGGEEEETVYGDEDEGGEYQPFSYTRMLEQDKDGADEFNYFDAEGDYCS